MKRTALTIVLVVLGLSALIVMAQSSTPIDYQQDVPEPPPSTQPFVRPVRVVNFPDPQNVVGTVDVTNFPDTQPVTGSVLIDNFPAVQTVGGSVSIDNLPLNADGFLVTSPRNQVVDLLDGDVVLNFGGLETWETEVFDIDSFSTLALKVRRQPGQGLRCTVLTSWASDDEFDPVMEVDFPFSSMAVDQVSAEVFGLQAKIKCIVGGTSGGTSADRVVRDIKVWLRSP